MADETPQEAPAPGTEGEGADASTPKSSDARGGPLATYLPLIVAVVVMPVLAIVTLKFSGKSSDPASDSAGADDHSAEPAASHEPDPGASHGAEPVDDGHGAGAASTPTRANTGPLTVAVPITRDPVKFVKADPGVDGDFDKIIVLDYKGEPRNLAQAEKIVVNIANTDGTRFAVARLLVQGRNVRLIDAVNANRQKLLDHATGALSSKMLDDINRPGFRNLLRAELLTLFNQAIYPYPNLIEEVIITEFVTQ